MRKKHMNGVSRRLLRGDSLEKIYGIPKGKHENHRWEDNTPETLPALPLLKVRKKCNTIFTTQK